MKDLVPPLTSIVEYTVSEIPGTVKLTLEGRFGRSRVSAAGCHIPLVSAAGHETDTTPLEQPVQAENYG